ncbi:S-layer homology domain-containing protein [Crocosphaera sp. UHCC 0190]|uniref:S-layer homology domain-containing protein n=1 Tax=Crocosphaera sp. UHCC 0190 TaxID=3110246 RepID=UPI002B1F60F0|nr:S-layer homology domain-containing protein [Crocosphaera sp. UHCC 0190]MEA5508683.1 S-layer homology domain-containing protein [Crocosphaera sp. UHCC 0190]
MLAKKMQLITTAAGIWMALTGVSLAQKFTDINGNPYQSEIEKAANMLIVSGFPDQTFRPQDSVTREQAISMIVDGLNTLVAININEKPKNRVQPFLDVEQSRWSAAKINWAQWNILPEETATGNFRPTDYVTRAELLGFLRRSAELLKAKLEKETVLNATKKSINFSDVSGYNQQLTRQMSAYCGIASPVNEEGEKFAPDQPANRDYTTAAILRTINCVQNDPK